MSQEGAAFIALARARGRCALPPGLDAALDRSAVSRAYYGAYWCARDWVERRFSVDLKGLNVHKEIRRYLRDANCYDVADLLEQLHEQRLEADYDVNADLDVEVAVERADRVVSKLPAPR